MKQAHEDFIKLMNDAILACDRAKVDAESLGTQWMLDLAIKAKTNFEDLKANFISGVFVPASNGGGLGISRALGEWAPDYLRSAGSAVEDYYKNKLC